MTDEDPIMTDATLVNELRALPCREHDDPDLDLTIGDAAADRITKLAADLAKHHANHPCAICDPLPRT